MNPRSNRYRVNSTNVRNNLLEPETGYRERLAHKAIHLTGTVTITRAVTHQHIEYTRAIHRYTKEKTLAKQGFKSGTP
ncbi:MAG: hypothetical protein JKY10_11415 [Cohaesibacteraceae bacterium]|nr:hypothetical protein [Cohaesibacteraceae bacterium]